MKIEITEAQLKAIKTMTDFISAMHGGCDTETDNQIKHNVRLVDRMLGKNNLPPRDYK